MSGRVCGDGSLLTSSSYGYFRIVFSNDGSRNKHIKSLVIHNKQFGGLCKVLHSFDFDL